MQEYKLCPFCEKAVEAENDNCTFCNGFLKFAKPVPVNPRRVAAINDPQLLEIKPLKQISMSRIFLVQRLSLMTAVVYGMAVYTNMTGIRDVGTHAVLLFCTLALLTGTWVSFGLLLRKFSGTADIARPVINMNYYFVSSVALMILMGFAAALSDGGAALFVLTLGMLAAFVTGVVLWIISAVRMLEAPADIINLPVLGKVIIASVSLHFIVRLAMYLLRPDTISLYIFEGIATVIAVSPFICLDRILSRSLKRIVPYNIKNLK